MNHDTTTYIAVTLHQSSPLFSDPVQLAAAHSSIAYVGQVGELKDTQLVAVPNLEWANVKDSVLESLKRQDGVVHVDVQAQPRMRSKRDEF